MKPFHTIAIPHRDILDGRLTMDIFAADLWEVFKGRAPEEYNDRKTFFDKTYLTQGLENLLSIIEKRLTGKGGDPVIQLQTPFGGGKTHALIALFHKAQELGAKKVVIVGTALAGNESLWGLLEEQLTGERKIMSDNVSPGKEKIKGILDKSGPVLILMDEVLEYFTKAAGVNIGKANLADLSSAFMQDLTEAVKSTDKVLLVVTLPSSVSQQYGHQSEVLYKRLQDISGRMERVYTPVQDQEISKVIRRRLFSYLDEKEAGKVITDFIKFAEKEGILPAGTMPSQYRDAFISSFPFMPEVIDILYTRWGSFSTFQRTRGVLRLLSLVIHTMKDSNRPYISLSDFDMENQEIRQELLKHIGNEFNSIIASDITGEGAGARKVDGSLGSAYQGLNLGTRAATVMFLYSFSGGMEKGITTGEVKRSATTLDNPSSVVAEASEHLKGKLFFLQTSGDKFFFCNQPNLNRIRLSKMENIKDKEIDEAEKELLKDGIKGAPMKFLPPWEENPSNIPDNEDLKVVILRQDNKEQMKNILLNKGQTPRVYRNTLFFLYPLESERITFVGTVKNKIACDNIEKDQTLNLSKDQKKENEKELKKAEESLKESLRRLYRIISCPCMKTMNRWDSFDSKEVQTSTGDIDLKEIDMGIPTYGEEKKLGQEVYDKLRSEGEILEKIVPLVIKEKYLTNKSQASTKQIYQSAYKTPGEARPIKGEVIEEGIRSGVKQGLFGLGEFTEGKPVCHYFKMTPDISFASGEVIISQAVCEEQRKPVGTPTPISTLPTLGSSPNIQSLVGTRDDHGPGNISKPTPIKPLGLNSVNLNFAVPKGKMADIMRVINLLHARFDSIQLQVIATNGEITKQEFEDKVEEAFRQLGVKI